MINLADINVKTLVLMSNSTVYEDNEGFRKRAKSLEKAGITELKRRFFNPAPTERSVPWTIINSQIIVL